MFIVTGANGFIGSAMVRELNSRGHNKIICIDVVEPKDRPEPLKKAKYLHFFTTFQFFEWLDLQKNKPQVEAVFHMGAISSTTETSWDRLKVNNIELSQKLYKLCVEWDCPFIYASSGAVYGNGEHGFSDQTDSKMFTPLNLYGKSKKDFDLWLLDQSPAIRAIGLRFFNVYGPNEYHKGDMASVVYKAFLQIQATGRLTLFRSHNPKYADGEQLRDFVYVKDITRWMWEIYSQSNFKSGIYNLGFGRPRTWRDLAENTFLNLGKKTHIDWVDIPSSIREQYQYYTKADMEKAFTMGLSKPNYSLEDGIQDYIKNHLLSNDPYI